MKTPLASMLANAAASSQCAMRSLRPKRGIRPVGASLVALLTPASCTSASSGSYKSGVAEATVIEARGLVKRYGDVEAVRGIDLTVHAGETFGFLGPNGAGKSTTIKILCTLANPTAGEARAAGFAVVRDRASVRLNIRPLLYRP